MEASHHDDHRHHGSTGQLGRLIIDALRQRPHTAIRDGEVAEVTGDVEALTGQPARTTDEAISDNPPR